MAESHLFSPPPLDFELGKIFASDDFRPEEIGELAGLGEYREFPAGARILEQGAVNSQLYFLLHGCCRVERDGEAIARVDARGAVLGEMSFLLNKPCSATILSETDVLTLCLDTERLPELGETTRARVMAALHRHFSMILAEKLALTNEKARLFEITNRELQAAKSALENASSSRLSEISSDHGSVLDRMRSILDGSEDPLPELRRMLKIRAREESSLKSSRVLVAEEVLEERINAKLSVGGSGVALTVADDGEGARLALAGEGPFDIIAVSASHLDLIPAAKASNPAIKCVFMTSEPLAEHFARLRECPDIGTILVRHPQDRSFNMKNTLTTVRKLSGSGIFGMEKYLNWGTEIRQGAIRSSADWADRLVALEEWLTRLGVRGPLQRKCSLVAEELWMNVVYDAPADAAGKPRYNHLERSVPVELTATEQGVFRHACDGNVVAVSVEDPFGRLDRSLVLDYLSHCFAGEVGEVEHADKGGGGNGLFQIIHASSLVVFNVSPGRRTEVIALFNMNQQVQKLKNQPSFHYFEE